MRGVRDTGALASALGRPEQVFAYGDPPPTLFDLVAAYAFGLARNHAFNDGNKRISLVATALFLDLNGYDLVATTREIVPFWLSLASGGKTEKDISRWLERHSQPK